MNMVRIVGARGSKVKAILIRTLAVLWESDSKMGLNQLFVLKSLAVVSVACR
jgi:hypothetical protein